MQHNKIALVLFFITQAIICVYADWDIKQHLGTRSPYWSPGSTEPSSPPDGCSLIHIDLVSRHGIRFPTSGDITDLTNLAATVKNYRAYINDSFAWIKNWNNPFIPNQQGFLSLTGQEELFHMAQRFNTTYSPLFSQQYYPNVYVMQSTQVPRTGVSAAAFAQGFLQGTGEIGPLHFQPPYIFSNSPNEDYLRFFDNCDVYSQGLNNGSISEDQSQKYMAKSYPAIAQRVAETLGVAGYWQISNDMLDSMFDACAFEISVFNKSDGWCVVFEPSDILVYEYAMDLEDYWTKSYGTDMGYQISSVVLQNLVSTMDGMISNATGMQQTNLRFAHAETIIPLNALLGFYKDNYTLTADLSQTEIENRVWTTSVISPFAGNLAFALYSCGNDDYRVKLSLNEVETAFPGCGEMYCPYNQFKSLYADALTFNYTTLCALPGPSPVKPKHTVTVPELSVALVVAMAVGGGVGFVFTLMYFRRKSHMYMSVNHK